MKLTGYRKERHARECDRCSGSGLEPERHQIICSKCLGVQYVDAETDDPLDDFEALRLAIRLLRMKDQKNKRLKEEIARRDKLFKELKPYMDKKAHADMVEEMYPRERTKERALYGLGGYGD